MIIRVKTLKGNGDVTIYYAMSYTSTTDAGAEHTDLTMSATGDELRLRQPHYPLAAMDRAIAIIDAKRSKLGAMQNRLGSVTDTLTTSNISMKAARSRIMDANYAAQVSAMTRAQILQQAGTAVLAQANQAGRAILSLLD